LRHVDLSAASRTFGRSSAKRFNESPLVRSSNFREAFDGMKSEPQPASLQGCRRSQRMGLYQSGSQQASATFHMVVIKTPQNSMGMVASFWFRNAPTGGNGSAFHIK
jgi:hypothetical protein